MEQAGSIDGTSAGVSSFKDMTCSRGQTHRTLPLDGKQNLVAADDGLLAEVLAIRSRASGATVTRASTMPEALKYARSLKPSLSIIDLEPRGRETGALRHAAICGLHGLASPKASRRWTAMPMVYKLDECGEVERTVFRLSEKPPAWPAF